MENRRIQLNKSMSWRRGDDRFSWLSSKWANLSNVLFPKFDFDSTGALSDSFTPTVFVVGDSVLWALGENSTNQVAMYEISNFTSLSAAFRSGSSTGSNAVKAAEYYNDGTDNYIYALDQDGDVIKFLTSGAYTFTDNVQTYGNAGAQLMLKINSSASLYYFTDYNLYKQTGTTFSTSLIALPEDFAYRAMVEYRDWIVFIAEKDDIYYALFYDYVNEPSSLSKTQKITGGSGFLGVGVTDGVLKVIIAKEDLSNDYFKTNISVYYFTGSGFREGNKIHTYDATSSIEGSSNPFFSDGENIYFGVIPSRGVSGEGGIYKVNKDMEFSVEMTDADVSAGGSGFKAIIKYNNILTTSLDDATDWKINAHNVNQKTFHEKSVYITPFLEDPYEDKDMVSVYMSFEETIDDGLDEKGTIQYRTKAGGSWTTILSYDRGVDGLGKRKEVVYNEDNQLPRFGEIQFKITSEDGLSITSVGYKFEYVDNDSV